LDRSAQRAAGVPFTEGEKRGRIGTAKKKPGKPKKKKKKGGDAF